MTSLLCALRSAFPRPASCVHVSASRGSGRDGRPHLVVPSVDDVRDDPRRAYRDPFDHFDERDDATTQRCDRQRLLEAEPASATARAASPRAPKDVPPATKAANTDVLSLLLVACQEHTAAHEHVLTSLEVAEMVLQTVHASRGKTDQVQAQLFNLLGVDGMDLIQFALHHDKALRARSYTTKTLEKVQQRLQDDDAVDVVPWLDAARDDDEGERPTSQLLREFGALQGGFDSSGPAGQLTAAGALALPANTQRTQYPTYEHVFVPGQVLHVHDQVPLVPISRLEPRAQAAFQGLSTLNRLQSTLFHAAYCSNQNLLVCAPTGAGKTNVAMLAMLHAVIQRPAQKLETLKLIYVAPMRALVQEIVTKFAHRLQPLHLVVKEFTGEMQLSRHELAMTHVIVTTPEKWDVLTRKSASWMRHVALVILDEVHLLAEERGPVIETIVARTLRCVERSQHCIRLVGLSATLPNYVDVATFLRVSMPSDDPNAVTNGGRGGLFFFDASYRPVPLDMTFLGVKPKPKKHQDAPDDDATSSRTTPARYLQLQMTQLVLTHCLAQVRASHQVLIFVHSRHETASTLHGMLDLARQDDTGATLDAFLPPVELPMPVSLRERVAKSRNWELQDLVRYGMAIHHAGMLRADRKLSEELFERGLVRVLCCTATLAWGVNLPAHSVVIKGTQVYNAARGGLTQLSMLDVMQIFGRAGRPQYDTRGEAVLITTHEHLPRYLRGLTQGLPMESALIRALPDHLNAEIVSGTITTLDEACTWLSYTYLYVRMRKNPVAYGMALETVYDDPQLHVRRRQVVLEAAKELAACRMIHMVETGEGNVAFGVTPLGRVASHFYLSHRSIARFHEHLDRCGPHASMDWDHVLWMVCSSTEFDQLQVRDDEVPELEQLARTCGRIAVRGGGLATSEGKTNVLLQSVLSRARIASFTLVSDANYVAQNGARIARALFELSLKQHHAPRAEKFLTLAKCIEHKIWYDANPGVQVAPERARLDASACLQWTVRLPHLELRDVQTQASGRSMLKLTIDVAPRFTTWHERLWKGSTVRAWIWVEDATSRYLYHVEPFVLTQGRFRAWQAGTQALTMECFLPLFSSKKDATYAVALLSDHFVGVESWYEVTYALEDGATTQEHETPLLPLHPLTLDVLHEADNGALDRDVTHLNPIQTQVFHPLYHHDEHMLLCAPSGSGKTLCAELAMLRVWKKAMRSLIVYMAPVAALARSKAAAWQHRFHEHSKQVVEVYAPLDGEDFKCADLLVTTPATFNVVLRRSPALLGRVVLVIVDELQTVSYATTDGAVLELLLSRMCRCSHLRVLGLSTPLANPLDIGRWLGVSESSVMNFQAAARPVPLQLIVQGFPERHYVARMDAMNRPIFLAIQRYASDASVLIFVPSKAQLKSTALELLQCGVQAGKPFGQLDDKVVFDWMCASVTDATLQHTLAFGIGLLHAGLTLKERLMVEKLYTEGVLQVVLATPMFVWTETLRARLVVVKGLDIGEMGAWTLMQMIGRAGRPGKDETGVACVLVDENKKNMTQRWLVEPTTIESCLSARSSVLRNELNAAIASSRVQRMCEAKEFLSGSLLAQRVRLNPRFYGIKAEKEAMERFVHELSEKTVEQLVEYKCVTRKGLSVKATVAGNVAAALDVDVETVWRIQHALEAKDESKSPSSIWSLLCTMCECSVEIQAMSLRPHEVQSPLLGDLCGQVKYSPLTQWGRDGNGKMLFETKGGQMKSLVLLQMHFMHLRVPSSELKSDLRTILDLSRRLLDAIIALGASLQRTALVFAGIRVYQALGQGQWPLEDEKDANAVLMQLPYVSPVIVELLRERCHVSSLNELREAVDKGTQREQIMEVLKSKMTRQQVKEMMRVVESVPRWKVQVEGTKKANEHVIDVEVNAEKKMKQQGKVCGVYVLLLVKTDGSARVFDLQHMALNPSLSLSFTVAPGDYQVDVLLDTLAGIASSYDVHIE
ncbi:hypothetical protein PsorP6_011844 [Peronosclerospora sorghi]|uniref:Uncharacterized protein n=1 Tax=Peronosclerospora sorghi TaxID=230839 RepID=A0ACC0WJJ1_9STRA|nr:hypothetical protein PsorP6_011844 [Peronosclerospora sorghi]